MTAEEKLFDDLERVIWFTSGARKKFDEIKSNYLKHSALMKEQEENNNPFSTLFPINGFRIDIIPNAGIGEKGVGKLFVHPDDYPKELVKK